MKKISNVIIAIGIVLLLGTAGESDINMEMQFAQILKQIAISAGIILLGYGIKYLAGGIEIKGGN